MFVWFNKDDEEEKDYDLPRNVYLVDMILENGEDEKKCFASFLEHSLPSVYNCGCTLIDA
jgi:hypothetical protein